MWVSFDLIRLERLGFLLGKILRVVRGWLAGHGRIQVLLRIPCLLEEVQRRLKDGMMKISKNEPNLMRIFYRKLGIKPSKFDPRRLDIPVE